MPNFMQIRPVGAELFQTDGWTDMTELIVAFHNFANAPKKRGRKSEVSLSTPWRYTGGEEYSSIWPWNHITIAALKYFVRPPQHRFVIVQKTNRGTWPKVLGCVEEGPSPSNTRTAARLAQWWPHGTRRLTALSRCMAVTPLGARREPASTWWRYQDPASSAVPLSSSTTLEFKFQLRPRAEEFLNFISLKLIHDCTVHRVRQRVRN